MYRIALVLVATLFSTPAFAELDSSFEKKKLKCSPGSTLTQCLNEQGAGGQNFGSTGLERVQVLLEDMTVTVSTDHGEVFIDDERGDEIGYMDVGEEVVAVVAYDVDRDGLLDLVFETDSGAVWFLARIDESSVAGR